jgi:hypothetical protein
LAAGTYVASGNVSDEIRWERTRQAYLIGDFAGGLIGLGVDDAFKVGWGHAAGQTLVTGAISGAAGAITYHYTGSVDTALFAANIASMSGSLVAKKLVPCFAAGTPVLTPDGEKPIEQLKPGDLVLSRDELDVNGPVEPKVIEECFVREGVFWKCT